MAIQTGGGRWKLEIPFDASGVKDFKPDQPIKVLVQGAKGPLASTLIDLDHKGHGLATFNFSEPPGGIRVIVGPHDATDDELTGLNTIGADVPARRWAKETTLKLTPILIADYYWWWWYNWCRTFTISGRVVCPDGSSPVVGATVCAYDVDWWWWYSSAQQIACATTDINGAFTITFKWCCGWWPWWWWKTRLWQIDPLLSERIAPVLQRNPDLYKLVPRTAQPSLEDFHQLLGAEVAHLSSETAVSPAALTSLREPLLRKLPAEPEFEKLKIWPWYPWYPWNDCSPDVIFKVTQNCSGVGDQNVIVNESIWQTRWDIPTTLNNVTLVANNKACCIHPHTNCPGTDCMVLATACGDSVDHIGGNVGAPATPVGYHNPNGSGAYSDQPYAGNIPITGITDCLDGYDYYEFEWATSNSGPWQPMPVSASGAVDRGYFDGALLPGNPFVPVQFAISPIGTQNVYETPQHYESRTGSWANRGWYAGYDLLINWQTMPTANVPTFNDGTYYLRLKGWKYNTATHLLENPKVFDICGGAPADNYVVLTVDNRFTTSGPLDSHGVACGPVHGCWTEPDTMFVSVKILNGSQYGGVTTDVQACGIYNVKWPDKVQIDFVCADVQGFLAEYGLSTYYGDNLTRNLLALSHTLAPGLPWGGAGPVPAAQQVGPTYADAFSAAQGGAIIRPFWKGGVISLVMYATDDPSNLSIPKGAFPVSCCYQLRLDAWKRTIVNCGIHFTNTSERSFTINVVP
jgi:hypothetical protein